MNSVEVQKVCSALIKQQRLPANFQTIIDDVYVPLAQLILQRKQHQPLLVSINGAQGTGKSTMTLFLKHILEAQMNVVSRESPVMAESTIPPSIIPVSVQQLSLDDFYRTRAERQALAEKVHPLLATRGVPGTHDIDLLEEVLDRLQERRPCRLPIFDKAKDERCAESAWQVYGGSADIILFEGWCNNSPPQSEHALLEPINQLEADEDADGIWRRYVNQQLIEYRRRIFERSDMCIMLKAPDFDRVYRWRSLQEEKLEMASSARTSGGGQQHIMNAAELKRFIQHFERITRHTLAELPKTADIVLPMAADHSISGIEQGGDNHRG